MTEEQTRYAVRVNPTTNRVQYITFEEFANPGDPIVDTLPEGNYIDYLFVDNQFVYSPLPPDYPICDQDVGMDTIFMLGEDIYRATTAIAKGEPVTPYNSVQLTAVDIFNALQQAQEGE